MDKVGLKLLVISVTLLVLAGLLFYFSSSLGEEANIIALMCLGTGILFLIIAIYKLTEKK